MSDYEILHEDDGWWVVYRKGYCVEAYPTEDRAAAAIHQFETEDEDAEREAREQDLAADRGDWLYHNRDRD